MGFQCEKRLAEKHKLLMPLKKSMPDKVYQKLNILHFSRQKDYSL